MKSRVGLNLREREGRQEWEEQNEEETYGRIIKENQCDLVQVKVLRAR